MVFSVASSLIFTSQCVAITLVVNIPSRAKDVGTDYIPLPTYVLPQWSTILRLYIVYMYSKSGYTSSLLSRIAL